MEFYNMVKFTPMTDVEKENIELEDKIFDCCKQLGISGDEFINKLYKDAMENELKKMIKLTKGKRWLA